MRLSSTQPPSRVSSTRLNYSKILSISIKTWCVDLRVVIVNEAPANNFANLLLALLLTAASEQADVFRKVYHYEGIRGFYRGLTAQLLKTIPASSVTFFGYETTLRLTNRLFPPTDGATQTEQR